MKTIEEKAEIFIRSKFGYGNEQELPDCYKNWHKFAADFARNYLKVKDK